MIAGVARDVRRAWRCQFELVTAQPAAAVPVELDRSGLPVAVQLVGRPGDEATLLSLSAELQAATGWLGRRPRLAA